jgi:hypothetical protein
LKVGDNSTLVEDVLGHDSQCLAYPREHGKQVVRVLLAGARETTQIAEDDGHGSLARFQRNFGVVAAEGLDDCRRKEVSETCLSLLQTLYLPEGPKNRRHELRELHLRLHFPGIHQGSGETRRLSPRHINTPTLASTALNRRAKRPIEVPRLSIGRTVEVAARHPHMEHALLPATQCFMDKPLAWTEVSLNRASAVPMMDRHRSLESHFRRDFDQPDHICPRNPDQQHFNQADE